MGVAVPPAGYLEKLRPAFVTTSRCWVERRASPRVEVVLPCHSPSNGRRVVARSVNISRDGILLQWKPAVAGATPEPGDHLKVDVALPAGNLGQRFIQCRGQVVRVDAAEGHDPLVAVAVTLMEFRGHATVRRRRRTAASSIEAA